MFKNNTNAVDVLADANLTLACNRFYNNTTAMQGTGAFNLSSTTTFQNKTGGNNTFYQNENSILLNNAALYLDQGYNNFIADPSWAQYNFITGMLSATCNCVDINNHMLARDNFWYPIPHVQNLRNAGSNYFQLTQYAFPHPNNMVLNGNILNQVDNTCFDTDDEELDNNFQQEQNKRYNPILQWFSAKLYPNPFTHTFQIEVNLTRPGLYSLYVYNSIGQEVWSSKNTLGKLGINQQTILTNKELPAGAYQLKLIAAEGTFNQTIIKK